MSYSPGTIVYAKLKGYPWWPARVEIESSLPPHVLSKKPKTPKPTIGVRFFGSKDYGWFGSNDLKPFDKKDAEITLQKMKSKKHDKLFERSIREALDPSSFDEPMDEEGADDVSDSGSELEDESKKSSESEDEDEGEYKKSEIRNKGNKGNKKNKKTTVFKSSDHRRTKSLIGGKLKKKSRSYSSEDEDDVNHGGKGGKKRRASEGVVLEKISKRKQRKIDYTDDEEEKMDLDDEKNEFETKKKERRQKDRASRSEGSRSPVKSDNESPEGDVDENKYNKDGDTGFESKSSRMESESHHRSSKSRQSKTPGDKLLHLRHRLQRMTLKDDVESLDTEKIDEVFTEVENFPITIPLLKESKIGKLMRKIAEKDIDPDPKRIIERSNDLIRKWKCLLEAPTHEGSEEETSPKEVAQVEGESPHREAVHSEESIQPLPDEQETDNKKDEENVDNNNLKEDKKGLPLTMNIDNDIQSETGEEKQITEDKDNIVTNGSLPAANNQEVNNNEKEDFNNKPSEL